MQYKLLEVDGNIGIWKDRPGKAGKFVVGPVQELKSQGKVTGYTIGRVLKSFPTIEQARPFAREEAQRGQNEVQ